ncbi:MAG: hemin uptake protein HemP [Hyphomicrobiales bacterium]|nr:hemin uptake protein HemP [Nitratireductor sp.]MCC2096887.1 hemin uptake protein HemP [Hyphomicrobiales bacterium]
MSHPGADGVASEVSGNELAVDEAGVPMRVFSTEALFGPECEIAIRHAGVYYRLRITRQGKLILSK